MLKELFEKFFGSYSKRELVRIEPIVKEILALEDEYKKLSDKELKAKTVEFKKRLDNGETLDDILKEAYATVREASWRVLGMKHFPVQLIGGIVLHQGRIAEMKTGEGKTLVATLPAYLNALTGKGVHVVTVNDYLAKRDSEWMGKLYKFLGLTVGLIVHEKTPEERKIAYGSDITYGTNNEFGFDYLRDNMVTYKEYMVQRELNFSIVDEVDSILIDEARTPLIISGAGDKSTDLYKRANEFVKRLSKHIYTETDDKAHYDDVETDYIVDEKAHSVSLTARGMKKAEAAFNIENLSDPDNMTIAHHINQALKAHGLMRLEKDYVIKDGMIIIVDEFTGRLMFGRRYSDGLHQAIEAKEGVKVERESKTLATITFQNYFRLYSKLAGMTGTALTEEEEFRAIYKLDVVVIPTNKENIRIDANDAIYKNEAAKFRAVSNHIKECNEKGQPVLVGTVTIEKSEILSDILRKAGIKHQVLNAKYHEKEAEIIAQAGKFGAVTIATNMAGRGTDIILGGNAEYLAKNELRKKGFSDELIVESTGFADTDDEEILNIRQEYKQLEEKFKVEVEENRIKVLESGGLQIIGTERHESRRIDNQLRGRAARQGDRGQSKFYISLEDDLMRLFGSDKMLGVVNMLGLKEDEPIEHKMLSSSIENAQKKVEGRNFNIRKSVLQFDDVMNQQRNVIYSQRQKVLNGENLQEYIVSMLNSVVDYVVELHTGNGQYVDDWNMAALLDHARSLFITDENVDFGEPDDITKEKIKDIFKEKAMAHYKKQEEILGSENMRELERVMLLQVVDKKWMDHIDDMDQLKQGIYLRAYGQRDPSVEYKFEGANMFDEMIQNIREETVKILFTSEVKKVPQREKVAVEISTSSDEEEQKKPVKVNKIGRNDPCSCGSGKKFKKCCGQ